ncbi:regulatory LuxR family protein [Saccharothrix variisporea]|uniref:Regulatory LuxR family protein n=2 Tax=Saccharothrix variisporea TaxID=543527 RepID=A0A495XL58_9PSEU|nr:regulatory LuxR family protein [Saccharothrix variisporea]
MSGRIAHGVCPLLASHAMANAKVGEALRRLGVGAGAAAVYLELLDSGPVPLGRLDRDAYAELVDAGLACAASDDADTAAPLPPATGLEILSRHRAAELDEARVAVAGAFEAFRRHRLAQYNDDLVEVVTGEAIGPRLRQVWVSARAQIRQFDSPPYFPIATATEDSLGTLRRGVAQRVVYSRESLLHPGYLTECVEPCVRAGEQARVLPSVPVKLVIVDDACALVSLSIKEADVHNTMLVVRPCGLLSALVALFEQAWREALPILSADPPPPRLLPADRRLLALLAAGVPDGEVARELGISRRTLFRRIEVLMTRLGATTRFQLALHAQRRRWL